MSPHSFGYGKADAAAIALGISGERLMEAAGQAAVDVIIEHGGRRVAVLCGPGNNGDGFALQGICEMQVAKYGWGCSAILNS